MFRQNNCLSGGTQYTQRVECDHINTQSTVDQISYGDFRFGKSEHFLNEVVRVNTKKISAKEKRQYVVACCCASSHDTTTACYASKLAEP